MADATLQAIRTKVRRLTRSLSTAQISDADIDEYVDTFVVFDFPSHLRLFKLHDSFTWYTVPNQYHYTNADVIPGLQNFDTTVLTVEPPVYVAGNKAFYTQSREEFLNLYPENNSVVDTGLVPDGGTFVFSGTLSSIPVLPEHVTFATKDAAGAGLKLYADGTGGNLIDNLTGDGTGTINYITGDYTLNFNVFPASGEKIFAETVPYTASRPQAMLYYANEFFLRPVPDKVYPVTINTYRSPIQLLSAGETPELLQWWQYIAYGAAKKIFEDRGDLDSAQQIMPEFKQQERLVLRRTLVQQSNERVATIYTQNNNQTGPGFPFGDGNI